MSNNSLTKFERPLYLELGCSRTLYFLLGGVHLLLLLAWTRAPVSLGEYALIPVLVCISWWLHWRTLGSTKSACAVTRITWDELRGWRLHRHADGWLAADLVIPVYVTRHLVVAQFKTAEAKTCRVVVVADRLGTEDFRRLRVRLIQSSNGCGNRTQVSGQ